MWVGGRDGGMGDADTPEPSPLRARHPEQAARPPHPGRRPPGRLAGSSDEVVKKIVAQELSQRVRNANAYVTRMLRTAEWEVENEGKEEGNYEDANVEGGQADEAYEGEGGERAGKAFKGEGGEHAGETYKDEGGEHETGEHAAFYSDIFRPAGVTRLGMGAMTFGQRDGGMREPTAEI